MNERVADPTIASGIVYFVGFLFVSQFLGTYRLCFVLMFFNVMKRTIYEESLAVLPKLSSSERLKLYLGYCDWAL